MRECRHCSLSMSKGPLFVLAALLCWLAVATADNISVSCIPSPLSPPVGSFYDLNATDLSGTVHKFNEYAGKVVLVINTASF